MALITSGFHFDQHQLALDMTTFSQIDHLNNINQFKTTGSVVNQGAINGDAVALIGRTVANAGTIAAEGGLVTMVAGDDVLIGTRDGHIMVKVGSTTDAAASTSADSAPKGSVTNTGTVRAGTMALDQAPRRGRLYSIDHSLLSRRHPAPAGAPRNPVFSLDGSRMYVADADQAGVQVYDFDVEAGVCSNPRLLIEAEAGAGRPNGMTIDSEGHLWIAWVGGWSVRRYDPDGRLVEKISLPVPMP